MSETYKPKQALPTLAQAKEDAKRRRAATPDLTHSAALELVAQSYGYRDWNGLHAAIAHRIPANWQQGGRVSGAYLGHAFEATVVSATPQDTGWIKLALDLDEAIDVVTSASFSNYRKRIHASVGPLGHTKERTSDGTPHLMLTT